MKHMLFAVLLLASCGTPVTVDTTKKCRLRSLEYNDYAVKGYKFTNGTEIEVRYMDTMYHIGDTVFATGYKQTLALCLLIYSAGNVSLFANS